MCNTVLKYLRTINHPNVVNRMFSIPTGLCTHNNIKGNSPTMEMWLRTTVPFPRLEILMTFHHNCEHYIFNLYNDTYSFSRKRILQKYTDFFRNKPIGKRETVANMIEIPYTDIEETIFQNSLLNSLGMFGVMEAKMLLNVRNTYFNRINEGT